MAVDQPLRIVVTGAGGFVGEALVHALATDHQVIATDQAGLAFDGMPGVTAIPGNLGDPAVILAVTQQPADVIVHLATIPGGAAEAQPTLASHINVASSMALFDAAAMHGNCPRIIYASSIAVFGDPLPAHVDDDTQISPMLRYGAHKAMMEEWIATLTRRGDVCGLSLRLPGIIARPAGPSGMKSAFMSDLFHALKAGAPITLPVSPDATCWLLSRPVLIQQIAKTMTLHSNPDHSRLNLPALRVRMGALVAEVALQTVSDPTLVTYTPDPAIEAAFGNQPPLATPRADALGLHHDGTLADLVRHALADI